MPRGGATKLDPAVLHRHRIRAAFRRGAPASPHPGRRDLPPAPNLAGRARFTQRRTSHSPSSLSFTAAEREARRRTAPGRSRLAGGVDRRPPGISAKRQQHVIREAIDERRSSRRRMVRAAQTRVVPRTGPVIARQASRLDTLHGPAARAGRDATTHRRHGTASPSTCSLGIDLVFGEAIGEHGCASRLV